MKKIIPQLHGFQLIELMIVFSIIAILAALSYPLYSHYLIQARRLEAATQLSKLAIAMEQYHLAQGTYRHATLAALNLPSVIAKGNYQLIIKNARDHDYLLHAKPLGNQAKKDLACASLTLDSLGEKGVLGTGKVDECW